MGKSFEAWRKKALKFLRANGGNVAMMFGLSLVPLTIAAGAGLDLARGIMVRSNMAEALDAAGLAVGAATTKPSSCTATSTVADCVTLRNLAQKYFNANYKQDTSYGTPGNVSVVINGQQVVLSVTTPLPTTLLSAAGINTVNVTASTTVVWGQTKLWVALVLDNTGSMDEKESGVTKMSALKSASHDLLDLLQGASTNAGDVRVSIVPFSKDVNVGASNKNASWIDWTDWEAPPPKVPDFDTGPGDSCPWSTWSDGYGCTTTPTGNTATSTVPNSGTYKGYLCPGMDNGRDNSYRAGHYYNGCYNSVAATKTTTQTVDSGWGASCGYTSNCSCSGSGSNKICTKTVTVSGYNHTWLVNNHSNWAGCVMDRDQDYDTDNTAPGTSTARFPAENSDYCPPATVLTLGYNWTDLNNKIDDMASNGNTNQTIGLQHGMMTLANTAPYSAPTITADTNKFIILLSDGLNTQNRFSTSQSSIDARMALACTAAKNAGFIIYSIFLDTGSSGNSTVMENCASSASKYYALTSTGSIGTTFAAIGQQITSVRVSQ